MRRHKIELVTTADIVEFVSANLKASCFIN